jgi:uncharacterized protein YjbI with pentapeptide repeats
MDHLSQPGLILTGYLQAAPHFILISSFMEKKITEDKIFRNGDVSVFESGAGSVFEGCSFTGCNFSEADLSEMIFMDCVMDTCNLSLAKLQGTGFQNVELKDCKLSGLNFGECNNFSFSANFSNCILDYTVWYKLRIKGTKFIGCSLSGADFTEADLTNAVFRNCNLNRAAFSRTLLKGADFRSAYNFTIDPETNSLAKARFSALSLSGLLTKYNLIIE